MKILIVEDEEKLAEVLGKKGRPVDPRAKSTGRSRNGTEAFLLEAAWPPAHVHLKNTAYNPISHSTSRGYDIHCAATQSL